MRILLIGTDRYVLDACVRRGLDVVLVRGFHSVDNGQVEVPAGITVIAVEDQKNPEHVLAALLRAGYGATRFDAVQTTNEQSLVTAMVLARLYGCDRLDPLAAVLFRDKWLQKDAVRRAGVATARSTFVSDFRELPKLPYERAVLKPAAGAGTALTAVVRNDAELAEAAASFQARNAAVRQFVLEEYVEGDEWVADGVVVDGDLRFLALGSYGMPCLEAVSGATPLRMRRFDPDTETHVYELARPLATRALNALGLTAGVFHMELFWDGARLLFSECAARRGGGLIQEEVHFKFGVDLADAAVAVALGQAPALDAAVRPEAVGTTFLVGPSGVLLSSPTPADLRIQPGVRFARVEMPRGAVIAAGLADTNSRVGIALVTGENAVELFTRMDALTRLFAASCEVLPATASPSELRAWQRERWPDVDFDGGLYTPTRRRLAVDIPRL